MKRDGQKKEKKVQAWPWVLQSLGPLFTTRSKPFILTTETTLTSSSCHNADAVPEYLNLAAENNHNYSCRFLG